ncbi:FUSC family protein [Luteococcus sp. Sow4_B9]|uniref:FUSC family protein n=1 Tax=Luteococcus sp. Sow4_B9 TaxID=3438792 RepID=UPI003F9DC8A1
MQERWKRSALHEMTLQAFDLSEQAARFGLAEQQRRLERWRARRFMIVQIALAAGTAWFLGQRILGHPMPFFASVAAILCLGFSFGQRVSRVVEVSFGVFIGVFMGDLFVMLFGTGPWQIALVCFVAMSVATWFNAKPLMINQSGIQAATVMTLMPAPGQGLSRWQDALLGCALAMAFALVAPTSPIQKPRLIAGAVLEQCSRTIREAREALRTQDRTKGEKVLDLARATEQQLRQLADAASEGVAVTRYSPFLRSERHHVQAVAELVAPLDRLCRNLRVLARRATIATWRSESVPDDYLDVLDHLADAVDFCATELAARRLPERARPRIIAVAEETDGIGVHGSLSGIVVLAQSRSMLVDLLELTGLSYAESRALVPEAD